MNHPRLFPKNTRRSRDGPGLPGLVVLQAQPCRLYAFPSSLVEGAHHAGLGEVGRLVVPLFPVIFGGWFWGWSDLKGGMDYGWIMDGLWMDYGWIMDGLWMDYGWIMDGLWMDYGFHFRHLQAMDWKKGTIFTKKNGTWGKNSPAAMGTWGKNCGKRLSTCGMVNWLFFFFRKNRETMMDNDGYMGEVLQIFPWTDPVKQGASMSHFLGILIGIVRWNIRSRSGIFTGIHAHLLEDDLFTSIQVIYWRWTNNSLDWDDIHISTIYWKWIELKSPIPIQTPSEKVNPLVIIPQSHFLRTYFNP